MHSKRGRPRVHRQKIDKGTQELQKKREKILEKSLAYDASLAESLLGILYAHHIISRPLYEAGCFFGELGYQYKPCLGNTFYSRVSDLTLRLTDRKENQGSFLSEIQEEKRTKAWKEALQILRQAGSTAYRAVQKVVFYDQDLYTASYIIPSLPEIKALRKGLTHLDKYFKGELKGTQDKPCDWGLSSLKSTMFPQILKEIPPLDPL